MKLIITIDTEEDNWAGYRTKNNTVENIVRIINLQALFDRYGVKPTYLITYPVATNPRSVAVLKGIHEAGKCEIGTHCHPWSTPPFEEEISERNSMLCNLPEELQFNKLEFLHDAIRKNFGVKSVSFRAGRWGFSASVAKALSRLGYLVDTSVSPFVDWAVYHGPDFSTFENQPYRFNPENISVSRADGEMLQVPATIGFLQRDFKLCHRLSKHFSEGIYKNLHLNGILHRMKLLNKVWLSPEHADTDSMIKLAKRLKVSNIPCLNMTFHSTSLIAGLSPFVLRKEDEIDFLRRIESFLLYAVDNGLDSLTLSQYESCFRAKSII